MLRFNPFYTDFKLLSQLSLPKNLNESNPKKYQIIPKYEMHSIKNCNFFLQITIAFYKYKKRNLSLILILLFLKQEMSFNCFYVIVHAF